MLIICVDTSPADWIITSAVPWQRLVEFGPAGFPAYARLRYLPDPGYAGQSENDADHDGDEMAELRSRQWARLFGTLASHTATAEDCYVCVWDGYADNGPTPPSLPDQFAGAPGRMPLRYSDAPGGLWPPTPTPPRPEPTTPKVTIPHRAYFLFHTSVTEAGGWDSTVELWVEDLRLRAPELAFVWPADRAWCVAFDVDSHWAGIGAEARVIGQLVTNPGLDAVNADPAADQPRYR